LTPLRQSARVLFRRKHMPKQLMPIAETSIADLWTEARATYGEGAVTEEIDVMAAIGKRAKLANAVAVAQDTLNRAEGRTDAKPEHWKEAHGEYTRLRRELWEAEGELLMLRAELERRVRRVRTGGAK
jgi:hypothetical protein